jgi:hypothetical protein
MHRLLLVVLILPICLSAPALGQSVLVPAPEGVPQVVVPAIETIIEIPTRRVNVSLDFLYFYMADLRVPPLVTTGPPGSQAVYGQPGTEVLRGDGRLPTRHTRYIGVRGNLDWWLPNDSPFGVDLSVIIMERDSSNITYPWHDINPLARPYLDANDGKWKSEIVAGNNPVYGPVAGSINVYSRMEFFDEDINAMYRIGRGDGWQLNLLTGAHFIQFRERVDITSASRILPAETTVISLEDHFQTFSKFYGGQIGLKGGYTRGRWTFDGKGVLALGGNAENIRAKGFSVIDGPGGKVVTDTGLYVQPSNSGSFSRVALNFVTEWNANLTFAVTQRIGVRVGYTLITWNNPVRPGDQIEALNRTQTAGGPVAPTIPFRTDFFWVQGVNVGLDLKW